uniref:Uncharacterized protein n=1 Tax=Rhipicephalus zambeziensis TaxID=60191 RepID=A0A224Y6P4_9ACAR
MSAYKKTHSALWLDIVNLIKFQDLTFQSNKQVTRKAMMGSLIIPAICLAAKFKNKCIFAYCPVGTQQVLRVKKRGGGGFKVATLHFVNILKSLHFIFYRDGSMQACMPRIHT